MDQRPRVSAACPFTQEETLMVCSSSVRPSSLVHAQFTWCKVFGKNKTDSSEVVDWPTSTEILCWYCSEAFSTPPAVAPLAWDEQKQKWVVEGCFCSWACALRWLMDGDRTYMVTQRIMYLHRLARVFGFVGRVIESPPRLLLKKYGGKLSVDEFRRYEGAPPQRVLAQFIPAPTVYKHFNPSSERVARVEGLRRPRGTAGTAAAQCATSSAGPTMYERHLRSRHSTRTTEPAAAAAADPADPPDPAVAAAAEAVAVAPPAGPAEAGPPGLAPPAGPPPAAGPDTAPGSVATTKSRPSTRSRKEDRRRRPPKVQHVRQTLENFIKKSKKQQDA